MEVKSVGKNQNDNLAQAVEKQAMGKEQFLELLVAQLAHQDPLKPLEDKEFVAQLAQFSGLEQMMEMNKQLNTLQSGQASLGNTAMANLVGRKVAITNEAITFDGTTPPPLQYDLTAAATNVQLVITDANGNRVRTLDAGGQPGGSHTINWDGKNDEGQVVENGEYHLTIVATDASGGSIGASTRSVGVVESLRFSNGIPELKVNGAYVRPADVLEVLDFEQPASSTPAS